MSNSTSISGNGTLKFQGQQKLSSLGSTGTSLNSNQNKNRVKAKTTYTQQQTSQASGVQQKAVGSNLNKNILSAAVGASGAHNNNLTAINPKEGPNFTQEPSSNHTQVKTTQQKQGVLYSPRSAARQQQQQLQSSTPIQEEQPKQDNNDKRKESIEVFSLQAQSSEGKGLLKTHTNQEGRKPSNTVHFQTNNQPQAQQSLKKPTKIQSTHNVKQQTLPVTTTPLQLAKQDSQAQGNEEDDFIDDVLDDSMELHESNTVATSAQSKSKTSSILSNTKQHAQNKINTTSPSKLNSKFSMPTNSGSGSKQGPTIAQGKQQNIKQSAIQGKKTLQSLQQSDKDSQQSQPRQPMVQLDLNLAMTNLQRVPSGQLQNQSLRSLDLRNNKITDQGLPEALFKLENLWKLQLDNNMISTLPDLFDGVQQLRYFTFSHNKIEKLPKSFFRIKNLEKLDFTNNKIQEIPLDFGKLLTLKYLFMCDNQITELPRSLSNLKNLQQLMLEWCQYLNPVFEKNLKKNLPLGLNSSHSSISDDSILSQFLNALAQCETEQVNFFVFIQSFYNQQRMQDIFQNLYLTKRSALLHFISKYNHSHLFQLMKEYKSIVDINITDEHGQTPLMVALNEKSQSIVEKILREYKETLDLNGEQYLEPNESLNPNLQSKILHPLMLAVKNQQYEIALRILAIMVKQSQRQENPRPLLLTFKDEAKNTLLHHLFQNFSANMELSVELCQEILKQAERAMKHGHSIIKLNEANKQWMTALDIATEVKQNQAIEFAIYYNKNMLPAFQASSRHKGRHPRKELFDINFNNNQRGLTPIHRAINVQNYKAIYLLLQSGDCNLFIKDRDFRAPRDYCQKILFLSKYLRKGETNFLRLFIYNIQKQMQQNNASDGRSSSSGVSGISSIYKHGAKQFQHNHLNFYIMSTKKGNRIKYNSWYTRLGANNMQDRNGNNMLLSSSQQPTLERKEEEDDDVEPLKIEDLKDEEENVEEPEKDKDNIPIQSSIINSNLSIVEQDAKLSIKNQDKKSPPKPLQDRRLSDQLTKKQPKQPSQQNSIKNNPPTIQPKQATNLDKRLKIQQQPQALPQFEISQQKTTFDLRNKKKVEILIDDEDDETMNEIEVEEATAESPTSLPSNKYKYVMPVNNSKLARKPYYKQIQKNRFEREFCMIMDPRISFTEKLNVLYRVFAQVQQQLQSQNKESHQAWYRDGREFLGFLKLEFENKDDNVMPLRNEILYFQEFMFGTNSFSFLGNENNTQNTGGQIQGSRKNNANFSLERGPLPSIQEAAVESKKMSPQKKTSNTNTKYGSKTLPKTNLQKQMTQTPDIVSEEEKSHQQTRLNTNSSQKKLESTPKKNSSGNLKTKSLKSPSQEEVKHNSQLKLVAIQYEDIENDKKNQSPTSPRANSGQIQQKDSNSQGSTFIFASPINNNQSQSLQKTKDSCIKKIEVQITDKQPLASPSGDQKLGQKWKQLTINPNATSTSQISSQSSGIGKGVTQKINSNNKLSSTPQSSKNANQIGSQLMVLAQIGTSKDPNAQTKQPPSEKQLIVTTSQIKTSSSLSNRSNSNPRNSIITGATSSNLKAQASKAQAQNQTSTKSTTQNSTLQKQSTSTTIASTSTTTATQNQNSKLKTPALTTSKLATTASTSGSYGRNTIGKPLTKR